MKQMLKRICEKLDLTTIFLMLATVLVLGIAIYEGGNSICYLLAGMAMVTLLVCKEVGRAIGLFILECYLVFGLDYGWLFFWGAIGTYLLIWLDYVVWSEDDE